MSKISFKKEWEVETIEDFENEVQEGELTIIRIAAKPNIVKYTHDWWTCIKPQIFIRPVGTKDRLGLVYAHNILISPTKYFFKSKNERLDFTLFFPALPKGTTHIDIIEQAGENTTDFFNFYNVPVSKIQDGVLHHF